MKTILCIFGIALLIVPTLSSARTAQDELSIALNAEFDTINPIVNTMAAASLVDDAALRPLVKLTPSGKMEAVLIKDIPTFENKKLQKTKDGGLQADIEFLAPAQWGDGTPLTCQDLKASWQIGSDDLVATPNREDYTNIRQINIDKQNPKRCTLIFAKPQFSFILNLPRPIPAHLELPIFEKNKKQVHGYEHNSNYIKNIGNPGLYNGPYRVSEMVFGSHVVLVPNEKYWGQKPYFKKVILRFILNSSAMEANLLSGNVQMTSSSGLSFDQALAFERKIKSQNLPFTIQFAPGVMYSHVDVNLDDAILKDQNVRQALAYSFNRKEMAKAFFENKQPPAYHFATSFDDWFTDDPKEVSTYPFSTKKAIELLEKSGWMMGKDGYRWKNGQKLSVVLSGVTDLKINEMIAVYLQNQWKQVGIDLTLKTYPARVFFADVLRHRKFQLALLTWVNSPNVIPVNTLASNMIPSESNGWSGHNRAGWKNKQVDKWLEQASSEFNKTKRVELMKKVLKVYSEELPSLPAYYRSNNSVIPKKMKGYELSGHVFSEFLQIENWRMEP
ncbi:peptide ABC transporter substrate-binding protein [Bdellovibrio sp. NC01]|uniref:peptide ABC transporter substrate-binding protein n=1 Tax=Bdellovibrio sp. NC01 TaxID=2220073 RepID=UPI001159D4C3|nr:peptide ABC transporter substrate-binding protein [Bdellovibrio sp. NC01]QDK38626.1 peptide ABC transporter substrate-binding protein [Bdellovibrio sp. NC01]